MTVSVPDTSTFVAAHPPPPGRHEADTPGPPLVPPPAALYPGEFTKVKVLPTVAAVSAIPRTHPLDGADAPALRQRPAVLVPVMMKSPCVTVLSAMQVPLPLTSKVALPVV